LRPCPPTDPAFPHLRGPGSASPRSGPRPVSAGQCPSNAWWHQARRNPRQRARRRPPVTQLGQPPPSAVPAHTGDAELRPEAHVPSCLRQPRGPLNPCGRGHSLPYMAAPKSVVCALTGRTPAGSAAFPAQRNLRTIVGADRSSSAPASGHTEGTGVGHNLASPSQWLRSAASGWLLHLPGVWPHPRGSASCGECSNVMDPLRQPLMQGCSAVAVGAVPGS
jgi:hypothetical protein